MPQESLFVTSSAGTNPLRVRFPSSFKFTKLWLDRYSINGVPVTAGVPNSLFYNLDLQGSGGDSSTFRNDNLAGRPLHLTGAFTQVDLSQPLEIWQVPSPVAIKDVNFKFTDSAGDLATFTSISLWFTYE